MFKNISSMKIKSEFFDSEAKIKLFEMNSNTNNLHQVALIYGRNGTGKSTLSKAALLHNSDDSKIRMRFLDRDNNEINLNEDSGDSIYVYNEDFMEKKVKFRENDNMDSIVMLGDQVDYDLQIDALEEKRKQTNININDLNLNLYEDERNQLNPQFHEEKIKRQLQETLAEREKNFRDMSRRPAITSDIITEAIKFKFKKEITEYQDEYEKLESKYSLIKDDTQSQVHIDLRDFEQLTIDFDLISSTLAKELDEPIPGKISNKLKEVLETHGMERIREIESHFKKDSNNYCSYCLRDYDESLANRIIKNINTLINDELDSLVIELESLKISPIGEVDPIEKEKIGIDIVNDYNQGVRILNKEIEKANVILEKKKNNPYQKMVFNDNLSDILKMLNEKYLLLVNKVKSINNDIRQKDIILKRLTQANKEYAFATMKETIKEYKETLKKYESVKDKHTTFNKELLNIESQINEFKGLKANVTIATKMMNTWLNNIFLEKGRISLEYIDKKYHIYVKEKPIKLKNLSNGERNAVALTYFFAKIIENSSFDDFGNDPIFLVLDDPLTSFDFEYKLGILSFLRKMISKVLNHPGSKILIFTHQLDGAFSINNMLDDIKKANGNKSCKQLANKKTQSFKNNTNMYKQLLLKIGAFVKGESETNVVLIPNKIRRILESFSTFNYGVGISQLTTTPEVLQGIEKEYLRDYFESNLYRIILNFGSHLADNTKGIEEGMLIERVDTNDIVRTTKDVLLLISELNNNHFNYVFKEDEVLEIIKEHKESIKLFKDE